MFFSFFQIGLIFMLISSTFLFPSLGHSAQVTLAWDSSQSPNVAGYKIYSGTSSGSYSQFTNVGSTNSCTLTNLTEGMTYYFAATAVGTDGTESAYSNQVNYTVPLSQANQSVYKIAATAGANGSISPSGAILLTKGVSQTFQIQPGTNYRIAGVTVDGAAVGPLSSYTFTNVMASHTIVASFVRKSRFRSYNN
jgi:fibronectin type 3 domain-containing protein